MKKFVALLSATLLTVNLFAQAESNSDTSTVEQVINSEFKTEEGKNKVYELSADLTDAQKSALYQDFKKSGVGPFFLNLGLGFGIGSFVQGDAKSGRTQLFMDLGGLGLMAGGYALMLTSFHDEVSYQAYPVYNYYTGTKTYQVYTSTETKMDSGKYISGAVCVGVGGALITVASVIGYVKPWVYASNWNKDLRRALRIDESPLASVETNFAPIVDPINNKYGLVAQLKF